MAGFIFIHAHSRECIKQTKRNYKKNTRNALSEKNGLLWFELDWAWLVDGRTRQCDDWTGWVMMIFVVELMVGWWWWWWLYSAATLSWNTLEATSVGRRIFSTYSQWSTLVFRWWDVIRSWFRVLSVGRLMVVVVYSYWPIQSLSRSPHGVIHQDHSLPS